MLRVVENCAHLLNIMRNYTVKRVRWFLLVFHCNYACILTIVYRF